MLFDLVARTTTTTTATTTMSTAARTATTTAVPEIFSIQPNLTPLPSENQAMAATGLGDTASATGPAGKTPVRTIHR
ncbi:hypothetical protein EFW17_19290 [Halostreptopolyspora alba]|uniref:Uncharacterized protein n=1 Tax=Halostreptopolyspora alba TaxID=2487137 RepID=A0A3N0E3N8_9ACTN|nr:hypothetical protein EFW17_19290 [Nocardiopsaceae bacterium YIM 96095]